MIRPTIVGTCDEGPLIDAIQCGEAGCFETLVTRYERRIFRLAKNITQNDWDAEDVLQEAFLKAYQHLKQFKGNSHFYTWLVRIAINQAMMKLRRLRPNHFSLDDPIATNEDFLPRELADGRPTPERRYSQNELAEIFSCAIADLHPTQRAVFRLREVENFSTEETANVLGISVSAVKSRLRRARLKLRDKLYYWGGKGDRYSSASPQGTVETNVLPRAAAKLTNPN